MLAPVPLDRVRAGHLARRATLALIALALALGTLALLGPARAAANSSQLSIMQDDDTLLYRGDNARDFALRKMKSIGVDAVRVTVLWRNVANDALKTRARRKRFKGDNPATYPKHNWDPYDRLVRAGRTLGIGIIFDVTGPGPKEYMGHTKDKKIALSYRPNARQFYKFVKAVGTRYGGNYRDENDERQILPRVGFWSIWNEPNQPAWLGPQYLKNKKTHRTIPYSPVLYRELFLRGRQALANTGHANDLILAGETAPIGSSGTTAHSPMRPAKFIRELFCLSPGGNSFSGSSASSRRCNLFDKFSAVGGFAFTAWAHHAYTKKLSPFQRDSHKDSITLANIGDLERLLDRVADRTGLIEPGAAIAITEFGYETKPPDPYVGISLADQAERINQADQIAFRDPRIVTTAQFLLNDQRPVRGAKRGTKAYWFNYQSGLVFSNGKAKPALQAYALPFTISDAPTGLLDVWGQLRFRPYSTAPEQVLLQYRPSGSPAYATVGSLPVTNGQRFFESASIAPRGPGAWRALWLNPAGTFPQSIPSREVFVTR